ncbi:hypothetical protein BGZ60DRAFT_418795 [Tricladium varicosporioides]|nr:hypothetical protein BGZ60DRAFT_418795 [Hymenoscyphus varicosporioides]
MPSFGGSSRKNTQKGGGNRGAPTPLGSRIASTTRSEGGSSFPKLKQASANVPSTSQKSSCQRNLSDVDSYLVSSKSLSVHRGYNTTIAGAYPSKQEYSLLGVGAQFFDGPHSGPSRVSQKRIHSISSGSEYASAMERYLSRSKREDPWNAVGAQNIRGQRH